MKKLIGLALLMLSAMVFVPSTADAQVPYGHDVYQDRERYHQERERQERERQERERQEREHAEHGREHAEQERDYRRNRGNRRYENRGYDNRRYNYGYIVRNEYRYVRLGRRVYKETYRSMYNRYGQLINRMLINRERVRRYDNYRDNDSRLRLNVFLRF